ncbi:MAG: DNA repair protein RadA [uncultured Gemmatimonadetes bacterium]|uniref:DNA repair protein RadA n=1 Tax=uncultured Gemmatimonadota bacterium TaxID=203437 RepID=A0A6J4KVP0_9BACT|nr:MAG: DNA repair protein RadA [uncultured Gemmatimonadota bacterium]
MAKTKTAYFCRECGNETARWQGQCPGCREWNTLVEEPTAPRKSKGAAAGSSVRVAGAGVSAPVRLRDVEGAERPRWATGLAEFDFVLGGGIVPGSVVLVGGEPGIGKSTILLQVAGRLEGAARSTLYVSGEESAHQVKLRADRLDEAAGSVTLLAETDLDGILIRAAELNPAVLLIDSIQTVYTPELEGAPGNVGQVRECAARLQRFAKQTGTAVFLVGHVTKGGGIAGPKTLEHIVDTVLYFESAGGLDNRVLRATKNRFGGVDEIGVFRMTAAGLSPVGNPSELFLGERSDAVPGSAVVATMEGTRPLLVEVQALAAKAAYGAPQRVSTGIDQKRLALLLAVLEKRAGLHFGQLDVFLNVVGGLRLTETATDAAVAVALASSVFDRPVPADTVVIGELGLGGELRPVGQIERRLTEAARMGFRAAYLSPRAVPQSVPPGIRAIPVEDVRTLVDRIFAA